MNTPLQARAIVGEPSAWRAQLEGLRARLAAATPLPYTYQYWPLPEQSETQLGWPLDISELLTNRAGEIEVHIVGTLGNWRATLWIKPATPDAPYSDTIDLHGLVPGGATTSVAHAVSRNVFPSLIVGEAQRGGGPSQAVLWQRQGTTFLPPLAAGRACAAADVNDARIIVGSAEDGAGRGRAVAWSEDGSGQWQIRELGGLPGWTGFSKATAINSSNWIVGEAVDASNRLVPTVWNPAPAALPLGRGYDRGFASAVADNGFIAGGVIGPSGFAVALWTGGDRPQTLYSLGPGMALRDINRRGDVLGDYNEGPQLWARELILYDFSQAVPRTTVSALSGTALNNRWWLACLGLAPSRALVGAVLQPT